MIPGSPHKTISIREKAIKYVERFFKQHNITVNASSVIVINAKELITCVSISAPWLDESVETWCRMATMLKGSSSPDCLLRTINFSGTPNSLHRSYDVSFQIKPEAL